MDTILHPFYFLITVSPVFAVLFAFDVMFLCSCLHTYIIEDKKKGTITCFLSIYTSLVAVTAGFIYGTGYALLGLLCTLIAFFSIITIVFVICLALIAVIRLVWLVGNRFFVPVKRHR